MVKFLIAIVLLVPLALSAQKWTEISVNPGMMYGLGDVNRSGLFYSPRPSVGFNIKRNFNKQISLKAGYYHGSIRGEIKDFKDKFPGERIEELKDWNSTIKTLALQLELNFLPYNPKGIEGEGISPFVFGGVGYDIGYGINLPFGIGSKYRINKKISIGIQWAFNKTFTDDLDNNADILNNVERYDPFHNRDWFSHAGIFIAYNISNMRMECPAYEQNEERRK